MVLDVLTPCSESIFAMKILITTFFEDEFYFETDPYLFSIVLHNLISNAIKYSFDKGEIEINVRKENETITFTLKEYGIGIPESEIDKVFNPFYRCNPLEHPEIKGTGLGLSIVSR